MSEPSKPTGAPGEVEITEEMIDIGEKEMLQIDFMDWESETLRAAVRRVFQAMQRAIRR